MRHGCSLVMSAIYFQCLWFGVACFVNELFKDIINEDVILLCTSHCPMWDTASLERDNLSNVQLFYFDHLTSPSQLCMNASLLYCLENVSRTPCHKGLHGILEHFIDVVCLVCCVKKKNWPRAIFYNILFWKKKNSRALDLKTVLFCVALSWNCHAVLGNGTNFSSK